MVSGDYIDGNGCFIDGMGICIPLLFAIPGIHKVTRNNDGRNVEPGFN
jgi:hypothetical protein